MKSKNEPIYENELYYDKVGESDEAQPSESDAMLSPVLEKNKGEVEDETIFFYVPC